MFIFKSLYSSLIENYKLFAIFLIISTFCKLHTLYLWEINIREHLLIAPLSVDVKILSKLNIIYVGFCKKTSKKQAKTNKTTQKRQTTIYLSFLLKI